MCDGSLSCRIYSATSDQVRFRSTQCHTKEQKEREGHTMTTQKINLCHGCPVAIFGAYVYCFID